MTRARRPRYRVTRYPLNRLHRGWLVETPWFVMRVSPLVLPEFTVWRRFKKAD